MSAPPHPPAPGWRWPSLRLRPALALLGLFLALGLWQGSAVRCALLAEGSQVPGSRPFVWELTGTLSAWLLLPLIYAAVLNAPGPRAGWARFLGVQGAGFLLYASLHVALMVGSVSCSIRCSAGGATTTGRRASASRWRCRRISSLTR